MSNFFFNNNRIILHHKKTRWIFIIPFLFLAINTILPIIFPSLKYLPFPDITPDLTSIKSFSNIIGFFNQLFQSASSLDTGIHTIFFQGKLALILLLLGLILFPFIYPKIKTIHSPSRRLLLFFWILSLFSVVLLILSLLNNGLNNLPNLQSILTFYTPYIVLHLSSLLIISFLEGCMLCFFKNIIVSKSRNTTITVKEAVKILPALFILNISLVIISSIPNIIYIIQQVFDPVAAGRSYYFERKLQYLLPLFFYSSILLKILLLPFPILVVLNKKGFFRTLKDNLKLIFMKFSMFIKMILIGSISLFIPITLYISFQNSISQSNQMYAFITPLTSGLIVFTSLCFYIYFFQKLHELQLKD